MPGETNLTATSNDTADLPPGALDAAVAASHAAPAPSDPNEQRMAALENRLGAESAALVERMGAIEQFIETFGPVVQAIQAKLAEDAPSLGPVINRVSQLEVWAADIARHFMNKVPAAPTPPA
jgi:hypothetical protein